MNPAKGEKKKQPSFWKKTFARLNSRNDKKQRQQKIREEIAYASFQISTNDVWQIKNDEVITSNAKNLPATTKNCKENNNYQPQPHNFHKCKEDSKTPKCETNVIKNPKLLPCSLEDNESRLQRFLTLMEKCTTLEDLCKLSWSGIPSKVRGKTWRLLSTYLPVNQERREGILERKRKDYWSLVEKYYYTIRDEIHNETRHQISIDVPRMNPSVPLLQQKIVQNMFERILFIWAIRHPASGYVQGINDLVTPFYVVFLEEFITEPFETFFVDGLSKEQLLVIEADTFWCLSKFLDNIQENYVFPQAGIQKKIQQLEELVKRVDVELHSHLLQHEVAYLQFAFRWFNNLLTREVPLRCSVRLWDTFLAENENFSMFQVYVCAAFLLHWKGHLMGKNDFPGLLVFLQNLPTKNWTCEEINLVVAEAYRLKFIFADAPKHLE